MATLYTINDNILPSECIGNSLVTINTNNTNIKNTFTSFNTDITDINSKLNNLTTIMNTISANQRLASGWVNFKGRFGYDLNNTATPSFDNTNRFIESQYNVQSVLRESVGTYLVNLTQPLVKGFTVTGIVSPLPPGTTGTDAGVVNLSPSIPFPDPGTSQCRIITRNLLGQFYDPSIVMLTFYSK